MERAARMSGARFGYWVGDTARLALALYRLALDRLAAKGFVTVLPPVLVREEALIGTGAFPSDEANVYEIEADGLYLAGTAEIPLASLHRGRDPRRRRAPAPLRRLLALLPPRGGRSRARHARDDPRPPVQQGRAVLAHAARGLLGRARAPAREHGGARPELGLPYRVVVLPAGDMSSASAKTYDVEIWFPSQERYRETASISNTTDFQSRRLGIRCRAERGARSPSTR